MCFDTAFFVGRGLLLILLCRVWYLSRAMSSLDTMTRFVHFYLGDVVFCNF